MRIGSFAAGAVALVLLLTWIAFRGMSAELDDWEHASTVVEKIEKARNMIDRDVLSARTGILRNYDPIVREIGVLRSNLERLRSDTVGDAEISDAVRALQEAMVRDEELIEEFKSRNALLQNSLAYFVVLNRNLEGEGKGRDFAGQIGRLAAAMLRLTLDTTPGSTAHVDAQLEVLLITSIATGNVMAAQPLLEHGRMLRDQLPATDALLRDLLSSQASGHMESVQRLIEERAAAAGAAAGMFRYMLYVISVLLVGMLVYLGAQLQARARALRFRANFEHVIAAISTRFLSTGSADLTSHVERALSELAACIGADRAYFVDGRMAGVYQWSRNGAEPAPGWPERVRLLAAALKRGDNGTIHVPAIRRIARATTGARAGREIDRGSGDAIDQMAEAGLHAWLGVPSSDAECQGGILAFDAVRPGPMSRWHDYGLFRMAFDTISAAVERDRLTREKERLEAGLQQARRMETVGALASGVAHNFNNIVGAILGYTEMARERVPPDSRLAGNLDEIRLAAERALALVDQILTFGRRGTPQRKLVRIRDLVDETASMLEASLPLRIELRVRDSSGDTRIPADPARLQQVLMNLAANAAQAMDGDGVIDIAIAEVETGGSVRLGSDESGPGRYATLRVTDRGRGMDRATQERIFEPFFTTRAEGNGLGLATAREIVREHGGAISVRSALGEGTTFEVWLPCAIPESRPGGSPSGRQLPLTFLRGEGEAVLILDGDGQRLLRLEEIVAALGYEPVGISRADEAARSLGRPGSEFVAALICEPRSSAFEISALLRHETPALPIILAMTSAADINPPALAAAGIREIVHSPVTAAELARALSLCRKSQETAAG